MISLKYNYIIIIVIFFLSLFYSLPNLLGENPVVIINKIDNFTDIERNKIIDSIKNKKNTKIFNENNILFEFNTIENQFEAYNTLKDCLPNDTKLYLDLYPSEYLKIFDKIGAKPMRFGLDLRGGVSFLIKIDINSVKKNNIKLQFNFIKNYLKKNSIKFDYIKIDKNSNIKIKLKNNKENFYIFNLIKNKFNNLICIEDSDNILSIKLNKDEKKNLKKKLIIKTLSVLSNRINELGISDSIVHQYGKDKIIVEIPGIQNIDHAKSILGKTATLKFMFLDTENKINKYLDNNKNYGSKLFYDKNKNSYLLKKDIILSGDSIIYATSGFESNLNKPCINIKIDKYSAKKFEKITMKNIGRPMAIVYKENYTVNNKIFTKEHIISIATIMNVLSDNFQITGLNINESKDLALLLRSGSLPSNISILEEKVIGPTLGKTNILNGFKSFLISFFIIVIFMLLMYKKFGIISFISLLMNVLLMISFMSILGATLTLPGIAGIVLTIGMSIDANILIFERIKEESVKNFNINETLIKGFNNAISSIIDANLTTLIIGLSLFILAYGPIKGFAITLSLGIITSIYTSIFVTKNLLFLVKKF
jgi:preprotein translocase subunit SecD